MNILLYDFRWTSPEGCEIQGSVDNKFGRKPIVVGETLSLEVVSGPRCAGSIENGNWKPCPKNSTGKGKCEYCRAIEGNFVYTAFDGFDQAQLNAGDLEKISGEHVVYLALFEADTIKIGVSHAARKVLRQVEQGSHQTLYIAKTTDGVSARQIETLLRKSGLADKVTGRRKRELLLPNISPEAGKILLESEFQNHSAGLDSLPHLKEFLLSPPEFQDWSHVYHTNEVINANKPLHPISLDTHEWVSGKIVAIKGPFIILDTGDEFVSIDAKSLNGRECNFDPKPSGLQLKTAFQNALF